MAKSKNEGDASPTSKSEQRKEAAFTRQQESWLGEHPRPEVLLKLRDRIPWAIETIEKQQAEWAKRCQELAKGLGLGHRDNTLSQLATDLLETRELREVHTVVTSPWITTEVPADTRRAIAAAFHHASALLADPGHDLGVAAIGLREASRMLMPPATDEWTPSVHQQLVIDILERDGRLGTGNLWKRVAPKAHVEHRAHQEAVAQLVDKGVVATAGRSRAIEYWLA